MIYVLNKISKQGVLKCTVYDTDDNSIEILDYGFVVNFLRNNKIEYKLLENYEIKKFHGFYLICESSNPSFTTFILRDSVRDVSVSYKTRLCGKPSYEITFDDKSIGVRIFCEVSITGMRFVKTVFFYRNLTPMYEKEWERIL